MHYALLFKQGSVSQSDVIYIFTRSERYIRGMTKND